MKLSEYSDEDLIEEIRHRGIKIEVPIMELRIIQLPSNIQMPELIAKQVKIGGVAFDIR